MEEQREVALVDSNDVATVDANTILTGRLVGGIDGIDSSRIIDGSVGVIFPTFAMNVVEFNQRVLKIEQRPIGMLGQAEFDISVKCLREEIDEFVEAYRQGDLVKMVDAMIDLKYFADGVLYKMGLTANTIDAAGQAVHEANMEKKLGVNARRGDGSAADAVKPEGWVPPEHRIAEILDRQENGGDSE